MSFFSILIASSSILRTYLLSARKPSLFMFVRYNSGNNKLPGKGFSSIIVSKSGTQPAPISRELFGSYSSPARMDVSFSGTTSSSLSLSSKSPLPFNQLTHVRGVTRVGLYQRYEEKRNMAVNVKYVQVDNKLGSKKEGYQGYIHALSSNSDVDVKDKDGNTHTLPIADRMAMFTSKLKVVEGGNWISCKLVSGKANLMGKADDQFVVPILRKVAVNDQISPVQIVDPNVGAKGLAIVKVAILQEALPIAQKLVDDAWEKNNNNK